MATAKTPAKKSKTSMMRKRSAKKSNIPAVRHLRYELTNGNAGVETSHYLDLFRDLSIVNRRLMRQGRIAHVKRITISSSNTIAFGTFADLSSVPGVTKFQQNAGRVTASVIPNSWVSREAWKRAFKTWNDQNKIATGQISGDIQGTWADFKVFLDTSHRSATALRAIDNGGNAYDLGEWEYTSLVTPDGTTGADDFQLHMLGNHLGSVGAWNSVGLIKSYGESRATVQGTDPNVPNIAKDDPLVNVFDYGTTVDEVINLLEYQNDAPPYDVSQYPGDDTNGPKPMVVQDVCIANGHATMGGFDAMCGLIELESRSPIDNDVYSVLVELSVGSYRGIKADVI